MLNSARRHLRSVAMLGVAGALVVGGVAVAQKDGGDGGGEGKAQNGKAQNGKAREGKARDGKHRRGGPLGVPMRAVTYAEFHVQTNEGGSKVIRLDQGTITAVSDSSITVEEKDGNEVTIDVNGDTEVRARGADNVTDLERGQRVVVKTVDGSAAKSIAVPPGKGKGKGKGKGSKGTDGKGDRRGPPSSDSNREG